MSSVLESPIEAVGFGSLERIKEEIAFQFAEFAAGYRTSFTHAYECGKLLSAARDLVKAYGKTKWATWVVANTKISYPTAMRWVKLAEWWKEASAYLDKHADRDSGIEEVLEAIGARKPRKDKPEVEKESNGKVEVSEGEPGYPTNEQLEAEEIRHENKLIKKFEEKEKVKLRDETDVEKEDVVYKDEKDWYDSGDDLWSDYSDWLEWCKVPPANKLNYPQIRTWLASIKKEIARVEKLVK